MKKKKIARIFGILTSSFGHKFKSLYSTQDEADMGQAIWIESIGFLTDEEIAMALDKLKYSAEWSPNVSEFVKTALNLPTLDQTIARVLGNDAIDPVSITIRKKITPWDISHQQPNVILSRIRGLYDEVYLNVISLNYPSHFNPLSHTSLSNATKQISN